MPEEEVEISEGRGDYEVLPVTPIHKLEKRIKYLEEAGTVPQLQSLIGQIIELVRGNQQLVDQVVRADAELRNELSRLPGKLDELITTIKSFLNLVKIAGEEEVRGVSPESLKPLTDQFQKMLEQNQKLIEGNQAILESIESLGKKIKMGTPVSKLLYTYPGLKLRKEE